MVNLIIILLAALACADPKSIKKTLKLLVFLHFQDLCAQKLLIERL